MEFEKFSHRFGIELIESDNNLKALWNQIDNALFDISWDEIRTSFLGPEPREIPSSDMKKEYGLTPGSIFHGAKKEMSLSKSINKLIKERLLEDGWVAEAGIFQGKEYSKDKIWRLDFSKVVEVEPTKENNFQTKTGMAVEVGFNHGEAIAWNLMKPKVAAELNHVEKKIDIGSGVGVMICASKALKDAGGFDNAVGEYEKVLRYLNPLQGVLTIPMVIVGIQAPDNYRVVKHNISTTKGSTKNIGVIVDL